MARLKRMELHKWMGVFRSLEDLKEDYEQIDPILEKNGVYLFSELCWLEVQYGDKWHAFLYDREQFVYDFNLLKSQELNARQADALRICIKEKVATSDQVRMLRSYNAYYAGLQAKRSMTLFLKRVKEKQKKVKFVPKPFKT